MKSRNRFLLLSFLAILGITLLVIILHHPDKATAFYEKHHRDLQTVADFLSSKDATDLSVNAGGTYTVRTVAGDGLTIQSQTFPIEDEAVKSAVRRLFGQARCKSIDKQGGSIVFLRWVFMMDFGSGFAFTTADNAYNDIQYLTKLEPMADPGWYYYEEDYNEWRIQNP